MKSWLTKFPQFLPSITVVPNNFLKYTFLIWNSFKFDENNILSKGYVISLRYTSIAILVYKNYLNHLLPRSYLRTAYRCWKTLCNAPFTRYSHANAVNFHFQVNFKVVKKQLLSKVKFKLLKNNSFWETWSIKFLNYVFTTIRSYSYQLFYNSLYTYCQFRYSIQLVHLLIAQ